MAMPRPRLWIALLALALAGAGGDPSKPRDCDDRSCYDVLGVGNGAASSRGPGGPTGPLRIPSRTPGILSR
jgi:hypothetical protein